MPGASVAHPVYAPALVVFVGGGGWAPSAGQGVGWFPLGPREAYIPPYQVSTSYVQRINVGHVANINQRTIERFNPNQVGYVNRSAPRGVTFVPRDVFVQSRPAGGAVLSISATEVARAPVMGMTAMVVPQRESIIARPVVARSPVPQPTPDMMSRRVYSRMAPSAVRVPFVQQQKALQANPGRPIAPEALSGMQRRQQPAPAPVRIVNTATLTRQNNPPVRKDSPQAIPPRNAPGGQQRVIAPATGDQQRTSTPAPGGQQRATTPAPGGQQRVIAPATGDQQRATTPAPGGQQQKPPAPATRGQGGSSAATLITTLRTRTLPGADQRLSEARKVPGIRLDLNAVAHQLASAKEALAGAEKDLAGGNSDQALQKATAIQRQIDDQMSRVSAAMQAARQDPQKR
jgi:hypothetical protein